MSDETSIPEVLVRLSAEHTAEHESHGWQVTTTLTAVQDFKPVPGYMMECSCGWTGWIVKDPAHPVVQGFTGDL